MQSVAVVESRPCAFLALLCGFRCGRVGDPPTKIVAQRKTVSNTADLSNAHRMTRNSP